ncbi:MAG: hypothetical protein AAF995_11095 [Planctomycetota bacterium]
MQAARPRYIAQTESLPQRFAALPAPPEADRLVLAPGTAADYAALSGYHYRAARPATMMRILTLRDPAPTIAERFAGGGTERGGQLTAASVGSAVAVLVESLPTLSCKLRDLALDRRYAGLDGKQRGRLLNAEVRCISRIVVDPRYRGMGLAVRLVRHALCTATTVYTEALAAMGSVSPFFERAGMAAYHRPPHPYDERLLAAMARCAIRPEALANPGLLQTQINARDAEERRWFLAELHRWYRAAVGRSANASQDPADHLRAAQQKLLSRPFYYLHDNRADAMHEWRMHESNPNDE